MTEEIQNRVAKSPLITIDLSDYTPTHLLFEIDIKQWLQEGLILIEKDFRAALKAHDWQQYDCGWVAIRSATEAIVPSWAYILIASYLVDIAQVTIIGNRDTLVDLAWQKTIEVLDFSKFEGKPLIIKGCGENVPQSAYVHIVQRLQSVAKSIFYGEACSSVPIYKKKSNP